MAKPPTNEPPPPFAPVPEPPGPQPVAPPASPAATPSASGIVADGSGFNFNLFDAQAAQHAQRVTEVIALVERDLTQGQYRYVPQPLKDANYHFVTVGRKGVPGDEEKAAWLRTRGYVTAPPMVRDAHREKEGDQTLILCARPEAWARIRNEKIAKAQARHERLNKNNVSKIEDRIRDGMRSGTDLKFETVIGTARSLGGAEDEMVRARREVMR